MENKEKFGKEKENKKDDDVRIKYAHSHIIVIKDKYIVIDERFLK